MGQGCTSGILSCVDGGMINTQEIISENSKKLDMSYYSQIYKTESRDPVVNCIEKLDMPLEIYENALNNHEHKFAKHKDLTEFEKSLKNYSPRVKVISSNFSDKSLNLIDKVDRTAETDKSSSSLFYSSASK